MAGKMGESEAGNAILRQDRVLEMQLATKHLQHDRKKQAQYNKSLHLTAGSVLAAVAMARSIVVMRSSNNPVCR